MDKLDIKKFDPEFLTNIKKLADALEVEPEIFIENIIIKRLADDQAEIDVNKTGKVIMPEFIQHKGEVKRGYELFKLLYNLKVRQLEVEREYDINQKLQYVDFEHLNSDDKEFMKQKGLDPESRVAREKKKAEDEKLIQDLIDSGDLSEPTIEWKKKE